MKIRLDRWLATLAIGSRSEVKQRIRGGGVSVNGAVQRDPGSLHESEADRLAVNGQQVDGRLIRHVMLHKPGGLLTAARDAKQPTVMDLLPEAYAAMGCMPVGRLDKDTTGLLLLTTDGELNHRLLSPQRHVDKVYTAEAEGLLGPKEVQAFAEGIELEDFTTQGALLEVLQAGEESSLARVTVHEGKFHQVKRMFAATGHEVLKLHRNSFGPLILPEDLPEGSWRELTDEEAASLYQAAAMSAPVLQA